MNSKYFNFGFKFLKITFINLTKKKVQTKCSNLNTVETCLDSYETSQFLSYRNNKFLSLQFENKRPLLKNFTLDFQKSKSKYQKFHHIKFHFIAL